LASLGVAALAFGSATTAALAPVTQAAAATRVNVFVGYADSARTLPNFPNPWDGSPNVTFDGCTPAAACTFDAGAVRVENDTASSVVVNQVDVHIDTCLYSWPGPFTLTPGQSLITTQLGTAVAGCTGPVPNAFDSSDIGPGGAAYSGCINDGIHPTVDVTIDGTTTSYTDSGQIINTGGIDPPSCTGGNESTQWVLIGNAPCPGQSLSLAPASQTQSVGATATVTANFTNSCGQALSGALVQFMVNSGPNAGLTGSSTTDASGNASFSYSSVQPGTDTLQASVTNAVGFTTTSNTVTVTWTLAFAAGAGSFVIGDLENAPHANVLWWGAQWAKVNLLSDGPAPRSFKGFEDSNSSPTCGQTWTTDPGNSSGPPATLPALMGVIVADNITKSGSTISGDIVHIVVVKTDPGYQPDPGHPGTGTIVAQVC